MNPVTQATFVASTDLGEHLDEAETKAWESLARYKFMQFGYWCAIWVHLNRIGGFNRPNPWAGLVRAAREQREQQPAGGLPDGVR